MCVLGLWGDMCDRPLGQLTGLVSMTTGNAMGGSEGHVWWP